MSGSDEAVLRDWQKWIADKLAKNDAIATELALSGLKQSLLAHAAVAVLALNALMGPPLRHDFSIVFVLYASLLGICLSIAGQVLLIELIAAFGNEVKGHLLRKRGSYRAIAASLAYGERFFSRQFSLAEFLVYGSVVWFVIYLFIAVTLVVHQI